MQVQVYFPFESDSYKGLFDQDEGKFRFFDNINPKKPIRSDFSSFEDYEKAKVGRYAMRVELFATASE